MTRLTGLSIRTILGALLGAMGLLLVSVSAVSFIDAVGRNANAVRTAIRTQISADLFRAIIPLRIERGAENAILQAEDPANADSVADILSYRQDSEQHYNAALDRLASLGQPAFEPLIERVKAMHTVMDAARPRADAAVRQPKNQRDPALVRDFLDLTQPVLDAIVATTDAIDASMKLVDPIVDQYLSIKRAAWVARLNLGQMVATTQAAVAAQRAFTQADVLAWSRDDARAKLAWTLVVEAAVRPDTPKSIVDAVTAASAAFAGPEAEARTAVMATLAAGGKVTTPIVELRRKDTDTNGLIVTVADTALNAMVDRAHRQAASAKAILVMNVIVLMVAIVLAGAGFALVDLGVTAPILAMARAMRRLADRDMAVAIPGAGRRDEIGAMAAAVQVFKDSMITAAHLAAKQDAAQTAEAERAARLERVVEELGIQNVRFSAALGNMSQALCMFDPSGCLIVANSRVAEMFGMDANSIVPGMTMDDMLVLAAGASNLRPSDIASMRASIRRLLEAGAPAAHTSELADGRTMAVNFVPVEGDGWLLTMEDITERTLVEARISHMAHHDALTGLPNRVRFHERLSEAVARSRRGEASAILFLDLDHFKAVNDTLGHPVGDSLLRAVAGRLRDVVRESDTVARLGGDEFAILQLGVTEVAETTVVARRIVQSISEPYYLDGHEVSVGTSIGIAMAPGDSAHPVQLMKNADLALYRSKQEGRGTWRFFERSMDAVATTRRALEVDLRRALAAGQFELHYQPIVSARTRRVTGFEALLRWRHPKRGLLLPGEFISIAEEIGLISDIGAWILLQACLEAMSWPDHLRIGVNLSTRQFRGNTLVTTVGNAMQTSGLAPDRLELEITESVPLANDQGALAMLQDLHRLGARIALDDFGSGYSSLSYLRGFSFDTIKIDRCFVSGLNAQDESGAIVRAIIGLAASLRMSVTAEGVETEDQFAFLAAAGCTEIQGYLISRPVPAHEVPALIESLSGKQP